MTATPNETPGSVAASDPTANQRCTPGAISFMDSLTERQREVFGNIAIGRDRGHHPRTLEALAARGLIEEYRETVGWDRFGPVEMVRWVVPIPVHIEWARWCAEQPDDEDQADD